MRQELQEIDGQRNSFTGSYECTGKKHNSAKRTILIKNIIGEDGVLVSDHLWFNYTKGFQQLRLRQGEQVRFTARVASYVKGRRTRQMDYKLTYPSKIGRLN